MQRQDETRIPDFADPNANVLVVFHSVDIKNGSPRHYIGANVLRHKR
jgi:hypothetical protein